MSMKVESRLFTVVVAGILLMAASNAQDFYWNAGSARSQGAGGVYMPSSANALDPLSTNPAGIAVLRAPTLNLSISSIFARGDFTNSVNQNVPMKTPPGVIPYGAFGTPIRGTPFSVGVGMVPELMSVSDWTYDDAPGVAGATYGLQRQKAAIVALRAVAAGSVQFGRRLSVGASVGFVYNWNRLQTAYVFQQHPALAGLKTQLDLHTSGIGRNYSVGMVATPSNDVQFGVAWKSRTVIDSTGRATGNIGPQLTAAGLAARPDFAYDAAVRNVLPQSVVGHVTWRIAPRLQLGFQSNWINWKGAFRTLPVSLTNGSNPDINGLLGTSSLPDGVPLDWKDQFSFRAGVEHSVMESVSVRAGFAHSSNPVPNSTLSPLTAAIMKDQITGGFGYSVGPARLDLAYGFGFANKARVEQSALRSGEYNNSSVRLGTQMLTLNTSFQF